jgi:hypothetical protein
MVHQNTIKLIDFGCARRLKNKEGEVGAVVGNTEFSGMVYTYSDLPKLGPPIINIYLKLLDAV